MLKLAIQGLPKIDQESAEMAVDSQAASATERRFEPLEALQQILSTATDSLATTLAQGSQEGETKEDTDQR
eukprot:15424619-Alexandrium_andersonii.AAC.1